MVETINVNSKTQYRIGWELEQKVVFKENLAQVLHDLTEKLETDMLTHDLTNHFSKHKTSGIEHMHTLGEGLN